MNPIHLLTLTLLSCLLLYTTKSMSNTPPNQPSYSILAKANQAYLRGKNDGTHHSNIMGIIDLSKPSSEKRFWVMDMEKHTVLYHTWVAHGQRTGSLYAKHFSNNPQSHQTSIGVYKTLKSYHGKHGLSLRLEGLDPTFNDAAFKRQIVVHGAPYVSEKNIEQTGRLGRSWGCFALSPEINPKIISLFKEKPSLILAYYPDQKWLKASTWI